MMFRPSQGPFLVGHSVTFRTQRGLWVFLHGLLFLCKYICLQVTYLLIFTASSFLANFVPLMIGATFNDVMGITPSGKDIYGLLGYLGFTIPFYIAYTSRIWDRYGVRIIPDITVFLEGGFIGKIWYMFECLAQAAGTFSSFRLLKSLGYCLDHALDARTVIIILFIMYRRN